jgi:alpha-L-fucosidase
VTQKSRDIHEHTGILDFERGREDRITPYPWLDDTALGPWFYVRTEPLKSSAYVIALLVDIVAKNGCMMLDVGPHVDGTLPAPSVAILRDIGAWLQTNGEAIYGTRPWSTYGEGPTRNIAGASFAEDKDRPFTARDIRFTAKGSALYAIVLGMPGEEVLVTSLPLGKPLWFGAIRKVELLGMNETLCWTQSPAGLQISVPAETHGQHAFVFKLT